MCGIFGYVGTKTNAQHLVLDGLKLLEYRGYDSWGIAIKVQSSKFKDQRSIIDIEKHVGKIGNAEITLPDSTIGIGHTRWATHGGVTVQNAHPHMDCQQQLAVIHNGIVENFSDIKEELLNEGHIFLSETDTEVISHLIEKELKTNGFSKAVKNAFNRLEGLNAIVVLYAPSQELVAVKNGSPMVIGKSEDGYYVASDASGIIQHTKDLYFLKNNEMAILGKTVQLFTLPKGTKKDITFETVTWNFEEDTLGAFDHFMIKEIHEQPRVIRNIAEQYTEQITQLGQVIKEAKGTFFIGAGTASYACLAGTYLFSKIAHKHVNTAIASEFNYLEDFLNKESLIIALSQSGETIDIVEPLQHAQKKGSSIVAIVNALGSTIYRMADHKLLLGSGPEKAVASTKAYTAKLSILLMLAYAMKGEIEKAKQMLLAAATEIERLLLPENIEQIKILAQKLQDAPHMYAIGRGVSYPTALEAAMKIKEVSYIHTEGLAGGELKHGPIALVTNGSPCIVFAPSDETYSAMISNATEVKARGGYIIGVSAKPSKVFDFWIEVKDTQDASIIPQIIPMQLLAYQLALVKEYDPDKPRNLAKSVTVK